MNILLTGADGYLGWPVLLKLCRTFPKDVIIAADNLSRRAWVAEVGSVSGVPIDTARQRFDALRLRGFLNASFHEIDLSDYGAVRALIADEKPDIVIHTAAQPSAPYSEMSGEKASFTQDNNIAMTRNILWALREFGLTRTHFIETTTTGIYGSPSFEIPEGDIEALGSDGRRDMVPCPNMASSWYHVSKGFNAVNMKLMHTQTGLPVTDLRTSIIYGADTTETREWPEFTGRFDFDYYFGTIFNRWVVMAILGEPITIYGSGTQIKPFIHLEDAAHSIISLAGKGNGGEYKIFNQLTEYIMIKDIARMIVDHMDLRGLRADITMIPNPRTEQEHKTQRYRNDKFISLLPGRPKMMKESIGEAIDRLLPHKDWLLKHKRSLMK